MCLTDSIPTAAANAPAFAQRLTDILNHAGLSLMISIGHRTGLFDVLATLPPSSSDEIAEAAGLNERYVREWLGAMVTGGIVQYEAGRRLYRLPPTHAAYLTRSASPNNMAGCMQWIGVLASVESRIVECFRRGGGLPYSAYDRFHDVMAEESSQTTVAGLMAHILPLVDGLHERLERGIDVLDVGCGRGWALRWLAERYPRSRFVGYDLSSDAIEASRAELECNPLTNLRLDVRDVARLNGCEHYDFVTAFDAIHDQREPAAVLGNIRRTLRPGGVFLMQDIAGSSHLDHNVGGPLAPFIYTISCMHCMSVSLGQGGAGLGAAWGEQTAERMLREAGFSRIRKTRLEHDMMNTYFVAEAD